MPLAAMSGWIDPILAVLVVANLMPILPVIMGVLGNVPRAKRQSLALSALFLGNGVAFGFALGGGWLLAVLDSQLDDLRVAGGLILLVFAIYDLLFSREERKEALGEIAEGEVADPETSMGLVPLGVPLMVGPATLTTVLVVAETYGIMALTLAIAVNTLVNIGLLAFGQRMMDAGGHGFMRASGKVFGLLLATLAITMLRVGLSNIVGAA